MTAARRLLLAALAAVLLPHAAGAQVTFKIVGWDATAYPDVLLRFEAKDAANKPILSYAPSDFTVVENGVTRPVISVSCPPPVTPPVSITFTFDKSFSMTIENRMDNMKSAATQLVNSLSYPPAQSGITAFSDSSEIVLPYTSDKSAILAAIGALLPNGGGTNFLRAFLDPVSGAVDFTRNRAGARYIIFITDAAQNLNAATEAAITNAVVASGAKLFTVTVAPNAINMNLRRIATASGGQWFEDVTTPDKANQIFALIGSQIFQYPPCELIYRTTGCDTQRNVTVTLRKNNRTVTDNTVVTVAATSIVTLAATPPLLDFGSIPAGQTLNKQVTLTARNGAITVSSITSPDVAFRVLDYGGSAPPFSLAAGQSRTITVQFRPVDTRRQVAGLQITCDAPCQENVSMIGGTHEPMPLRVITPNGGEKLFSGTTYRMTWTGVSLSLPVEVDYSTNSGSAWTTITPNAYNLFYTWRVPNTPSTTCLAHAHTRPERLASLDAAFSPLQPADITDVDLAPSGALGAIALANGQLKLIYPKDGALLRQISAHTGKVNTVSISPDLRWVASGGDDGVVNVWDTWTGALGRMLTGFTGPVHSVRFSRDGAWLAGADAGRIILWSTTNWGEAWRHTGHTMTDGALSIAPRNDWIASASGSDIAILRFSDGGLIRTLSGHAGTVRAVDVSDDGQEIVSGGEDRMVMLWNTFTWAPTRTIPGHSDAVVSVQATNAAATIVSASRDNTVRVWDGVTGSQMYAFTGHSDDVAAAKADARLKLILSGGRDRGTRVWGYVAPLADKSDSLWTIITTVTSLNIDPPQFLRLTCPGESSTGEAVVVNVGNQVVTVRGARITGPDSAAFSFDAGFSIPPDRVLQPEDTLGIPLRFTPGHAGDFQAVLELETDLPVAPLITTPLTGKMDSVRIVVNPDTIVTGELYSCTMPALMPLIITNTGTVLSTVDSAATDLEGLVDFQGLLPHDLMPGETDTLWIAVHPAAEGVFENLVRFRVAPCGLDDTVRVITTRVSTTPVLVPSPLSFDFTAVGDVARDSIAIVNPTGVEMTIDSVALRGLSFAFSSAFPLPRTIGPHDTIFVPISYAPQTEGDASGALFVHSTAPCVDSATALLFGSSQRKPEIDVSGGAFPNLLCPDQISSDGIVIVRNVGGLPLHVSDLTKLGAMAGDFTILSPPVPFIVAPGAQDTIRIRFQAGAPGDRSATLTITSDAVRTPVAAIVLSGRKDSVAYTLTPTLFSEGMLYPCDLPVTRTLRFRNTGTVVLRVALDTALIPAGVIIDRGLFPLLLQAGGVERSIPVTIQPGAFGTVSGYLRFTSDVCPDMQQALVSFGYTDPTLAASPSALDFGTLGLGGSASRAVTLSSGIADTVRIASVQVVPPATGLTIDTPASLPAAIPGNGTLQVGLTWAPTAPDTLQSTLVVVVDAPCPDTLRFPLTGTVRAASARFETAQLSGAPGERVRVPLTLVSSSNLALTGARSVTADFVFNRTLLWPERVVSTTGTATMIVRDETPSARVTVRVDQSASPSNGVLAEVECLVMLGDAEQSPILLENVAWLVGSSSIETADGGFTLTGICREGGARLMAAPTGPVIYPNVPNPFNPSTRVTFFLPETQEADLRVHDALGREVAVLAQGMMSKGEHACVFEASQLPAGVYIATLRTGGTVRTLRMVLLK